MSDGKENPLGNRYSAENRRLIKNCSKHCLKDIFKNTPPMDLQKIYNAANLVNVAPGWRLDCMAESTVKDIHKLLEKCLTDKRYLANVDVYTIKEIFRRANTIKEASKAEIKDDCRVSSWIKANLDNVLEAFEYALLSSRKKGKVKHIKKIESDVHEYLRNITRDLLYGQ